MFRSALLAALAVSALALAQGPVTTRGSMPAPLSTTQKAVQADAVVVGKVTAIEAEDAEVLPFAGAADKVKWKVGVIKVETGLIGAKNVTHVKVLFPPPVAAPPVNPGAGGPIIVRTGGGYAPVTLKEGEEGLYFLSKHPTAANYYHIQPHVPPVAAKAETYKDDVAKVTAVVAALADPLKALTADKIEDRLVAASVVLRRTRQGSALPGLKEVALPAEQTKAILKALLDADWTVADKPTPGFDYNAAPLALAGRLELQPGSPNGVPAVQAKPGESYTAKAHEAFKAWHAKSAAAFEIKVLVPKD